MEIRLKADTSFVVFGDPSESGHAHFDSASCFFLKTPRRLLVVTARHVFSSFRKQRERNARVKLQIGNLPFDAEARLVGLGEKTDIATFDATEADLNQLQKFPITLWPPHPPDRDDQGILLAGYPAKVIEMTGPRTASFGIYTASGIAQRTTDRQLSCQVEWNNSFPIPQLGELPPKQLETGGMSGGPVLNIASKNGLLSFPLAGVISEGFAERDIIIAERADFIRADGSVRD